MSFETSVLALIQQSTDLDQSTKEALIKIATDLYTAYNNLFPPVTRSFSPTGTTTAIPNITGFTVNVFPNNVRLSWDRAANTLETYKIRYQPSTSTDWDSAIDILTTPTLAADINPISIPLTYGDYTFLIKGEFGGKESTTAATVSINIPQITAPVVNAQVIDNNVLLKWTIPDVVFQLDHYNVTRDDVFIGNMKGTFEAIFETVAGTYIYGVTAVDIVGNEGAEGTITTSVNQPTDYELQDSRLSAFGGTKVNAVLDSVRSLLIACLSTTQTWTTHFTGPGWTDIQDQINAGYPYFAEPGLTTASYEEVIDYGILISNTILSLDWSILSIVGAVVASSKISFSTDNITYTTPVSATSAFSASMRYAKIHIDFAGDAHSIAEFSNLQILLDVKREVDSGSIAALSTDVSGTPVLFNKAFRDVDSITLTVGSTTPKVAVYDFVDIPDPTGFSVYLFNLAGTRVSGDVSWKARGIV